MYLQNRERWFNINTLHFFAAFMYHDHHNSKVQILNLHMMSDKFKIHDDTESIISVMWKESHYRMCEFVLDKETTVDLQWNVYGS